MQSMSVEELMGVISPKSFISMEALCALVRHEQLLSKKEAWPFLQGCGGIISLEDLKSLLQRCQNQDANDLKQVSEPLPLSYVGDSKVG